MERNKGTEKREGQGNNKKERNKEEKEIKKK
jgi:hypothetical protein